ncbi:MAG: AAA domain-containing protein [Imperialibacter sp.]|uniref:AAA domain-containing protein n=1 Tax=Imperialibacter sp. TaxID=2038411 RepID=UPI0032EB8B32
MRKILQSYLRKLTNLTANNRSLLLLRLASEQFLDLHDFDFTLGQPSFHIISDLIAQKARIPLCQIMDSRDYNNNNLSVGLKKLHRLDQFVFQERGGKDLYVGWPFVHGKFSDGTLVRCPLLFFPVSLEMDQKNWVMIPRKDVNVTLNKTFLLGYAYYNKISLDEDLIERVFDDFDKDSRVFRTALYELLRDSKVEVNFNPDNFTDQLTGFTPFLKDKFELGHDTGKLKLMTEAVLGIFPQNGSYMVPDYLKLIEENTLESLEDFFVGKTNLEDVVDKVEYSYVSKIKEEQTFTPFAIDAFQENALKTVKNGHSLVIQGPPGTGKSQLICNLVSDFIARGKKVLVVCQKRAALDVVHQRLSEKDLGAFVALVHDFKNDRKEIYEQLASQIERLDEYKLKNNSLDAIQLEREFTQVSRKIDQISEELNEFKQALFDDKESGKSVKELYLSSDLKGRTITLKQEYKYFTYEKLEAFQRKIGYYVKYSSVFRTEAHPWVDRVSFSHFGVAELGRVKELVAEILKFNQALATRSKEALGEALSFDECQDMLERRGQVKEMFSLINDKTVYETFVHMSAYPDSETDALWLANNERILMECYKGLGPELSTPGSELGRLQEALERGRKARKGLFSWFRWKFFSKDKVFISRVLVANNLESNKKGFEELMIMVDSRLNLEHNLTKLRTSEWILNPPNAMSKIDLQNWFFFVRRAINAKMIFSSLRPVAKVVNPKNYTFEELKELTDRSFEALEEIPLKWEQWQGYFTPKQVKMIIGKKGYAEELLKRLDKDFDSLVEYDKLLDSVLPYENQIFEKLEEILPDWDEKEWNEIFENSLNLQWIDHIETKYPILRAVSSLKLDTLTKELQEAVLKKNQLSGDILLLRIREKTYSEVEYNRLNNPITYRDLQHQVTKKKRVWPIRRLLAHMSAEAFRLVPCWLTSPEAASAIFQLDEIFDLVIFDEASQCFVENGLAAMYRGKQVVVSGDDKQLQPNDLYKIRWEQSEEEEEMALEADSLLTLARQHLNQVSLQGHYRSRSLDLIDFSNHYFYKGKLQLVPHFEVINEAKPAISYEKVDGIWESSRNEEEAARVVDLIVSCLKKSPDKSIGVVTFNAAQQSHILDLLDTYQADHKKLLPDSLFVKNIENVQGDERDIIIFTIGYAPDAKGKLQMKFGSLNLEGGENRLNVAVTRAKEQIFVVSSILPHQLNVDGLRNEGPKMLRKYLEYAFTVSNGEFRPYAPKEPTFSQHWYLKSRMTKWLETVPQMRNISMTEDLNFADLTVKKREEFLGLIFTDDDTYFNSISAKDAYVYRYTLLMDKKWRSTQFYSREFWIDPEGAEERLYKFIGQIE